MKILVIGDYISDVYTFGTATRLCPEAPVPVIVPQSTRTSAGGAGLVHEQLKSLGASVDYFYFSRSTKRRYFAGSHLVCRIDEDSHDVSCPSSVEGWFDDADAFVISDYGKGAMTRELARQIVETGKKVFVDAKHHWEWYQGHNVFAFPNELEAPQVENMFIQVIKKLGAKGCEWDYLKIPATVSEVADTTGAGDIFMASFVYAWSLQLPAEDCLRFANELAGESCRHIGTHVVSRQFAQSVLDRLRASQASAQQSLASSLDSMPSALEQQRVQARQCYPEGGSGVGSPPEYCSPAQVEMLSVQCSLPPSQTHPGSPLVPTESTDVPTQEDQETLPGSNGTPQSEG